MTIAGVPLEMVRVAVYVANDKLADDVVAIDVSEQLVITDAFVIASADSERHVISIVGAMEDAMRDAGYKATRREGTKEGRWALLDYIDIVIHILHTDEREFYALERLWKDCAQIDFCLLKP